MNIPPKFTDLRGTRLTTRQIYYLAHLKMCVKSIGTIQAAFKKEFGRSISVYTVSWCSHHKKAKLIFEKVKEQYEKNVGHEFFASKINRVRALSELYDKAKESRQLNVCHDIVKTFNDMFDPKRQDGDKYYIQNNEYLNMTVPELKHEIRLLSKKLGPELLKITQSPENV